jgi:hypothetical protein
MINQSIGIYCWERVVNRVRVQLVGYCHVRAEDFCLGSFRVIGSDGWGEAISCGHITMSPYLFLRRFGSTSKRKMYKLGSFDVGLGATGSGFRSSSFEKNIFFLGG